MSAPDGIASFLPGREPGEVARVSIRTRGSDAPIEAPLDALAVLAAIQLLSGLLHQAVVTRSRRDALGPNAAER